jgi:murein DD-endopeptidase MepM/ murein hydrolase activator NlpD
MKKFAFLLLFNFAIAQNLLSYTVQAGDTLFAIASAYATSVSEIRRLNGLTGDFLEVGQVLNVPAQTTIQVVPASSQATPARSGVVQHTVGVGHTLANLSQMYGLSEATLLNSNPGLESYSQDTPLAEGLVLQIPPGEGSVLLLESGQTLLAVALEHGMTVSELAKANGVKKLQSGQYVFIPAGHQKEFSAAPESVQMVSKQDFRGLHLQAQKSVIARAASLLAVYKPVAASVQTFMWPVQGRLTSMYGRRNVSVGGNTFHGGVDVAAPTGTPIAASKSGTVVKAGWGGAYGYVVYLDHGDGSQTRYAHMSQIKVTMGSFVNQQDVLGLVGSTGASTGPHLHFEIRFEGRSVDPLGYLATR